VKEKPSHIKSVSNPEESSQNRPQPPPSNQGTAPRLIRYEDDSNQTSNQVYVYPKSYIHSYHPSPRSYKASLESRRAPASLFSFHPTTSSSSTTSLPEKASLFVNSDNPSPSNSSSAAADLASHSQNQTVTSSSTMSSSIANNASTAAEQLKQRNSSGKSETQKEGHSHDGHSHGWLGGHSHNHNHEGSAEEADQLLAALRGKGELDWGLGENLEASRTEM